MLRCNRRQVYSFCIVYIVSVRDAVKITKHLQIFYGLWDCFDLSLTATAYGILEAGIQLTSNKMLPIRLTVSYGIWYCIDFIFTAKSPTPPHLRSLY